MPLYLGLDAAAEGLNAIVIEAEGEVRRVVFNRSLNFDRDLPEYGTTGGVRHTAGGDVPASPVMWADALDRMMGRLAAAAEIEVERIRAIAGCAQPHHTLELNQRVAELAEALRVTSRGGRRLDRRPYRKRARHRHCPRRRDRGGLRHQRHCARACQPGRPVHRSSPFATARSRVSWCGWNIVSIGMQSRGCSRPHPATTAG